MGFYLEKRKERDKNMGRVEHVEPKRERKKERSVLQMKKKSNFLKKIKGNIMEKKI